MFASPTRIAQCPIAHDAPLGLLTVGRVSVDLYAEQTGVGFADARTFAKSVGGSPTNVAVAAARLGHRAAVVTAVGADPFGEYVREALAGFGVDTDFVGTHPGLRTPLAFAAMDPPEDPQLLFYRAPEAVGPRGPGLVEDRRAVATGIAARAAAVRRETLEVGRDWPWGGQPVSS